MSERKRWVRWDHDEHPIEELYVCQSCDAHMHVDSMGDECPNCGAQADEDPTAIRQQEKP